MANPAAITITDLTANAGLNQPAVQTIDTDGTVPSPAAGKTDRLILELINAAAAALTVTVKAGVGEQSVQAKDLVVAMAATGTATDKRIVGPFESSRFLKANGSIDVAFLAASGSPNCTVRAYRLPKAV